MASYFKLCGTYLISGVGLAASILHFKKVTNDDDFIVQSARPAHTSGVATSTKWDYNWDKRNPQNLLEERGIEEDDPNYRMELEKYKPKATRNIFLIRHGQYNLKGSTDEERYLTNLGRAQAEYTGNRLKELQLPYNTLHRSTLTRAMETADIILSCFKDKPIEDIRSSELLEEGAPIPPEPPVKHWRPEVHFYQDGPRIEAAFRKYFHRADASQVDDSYEVIVCHSNVIRYFVCRALQFPPDAWLRFTIHHCSITWLAITPTGRVVVRCIGDAGHMPVNAITST